VICRGVARQWALPRALRRPGAELWR